MTHSLSMRFLCSTSVPGRERDSSLGQRVAPRYIACFDVEDIFERRPSVRRPAPRRSAAVSLPSRRRAEFFVEGRLSPEGVRQKRFLR